MKHKNVRFLLPKQSDLKIFDFRSDLKERCRFANESFRQRLVRQRPKSLRQRPTGQFANV